MLLKKIFLFECILFLIFIIYFFYLFFHLFFMNEVNKEKNNSLDYLPIKSNELNINKFFTEEEQKNLKIFYDPITKRLIAITPLLIKVFNRKGEILKREIHYPSIEKVINTVVNKDVEYLLVCSQLKTTQRIIFCINALNSQLIITIKIGDYSSLLGMFFVSKYNFCIICANRIEYHFFERGTEEYKEKLVIKCKGRYLIKNFHYCRQYFILLIERSDYSFDIYNLRNKELYLSLVKNFSIIFNEKKILTKTKSKTLQSVSHFFSIKKFNEKEEFEKILKLAEKPNEKYKNGQYFLHILYTKLYFIYLSYEDNKIYIMKLKNLKTFPEEDEGNKLLKIPYDSKDQNSTIQFVDNLILVHNLSKKQTMIIDLKFKNKDNCENYILTQLIGVDFPFFNCEKYQIYIKGSLVETVDSNNNRKLYYLEFDLNNFIDHFFKKNEALFYLTRRGKSKEYILQVFKDMILDEKESYESIFWLIDKFSEQIKKNEKIAKDLVSNVKYNEKVNKEYMELDIRYYMTSRKNIITQDQFLMHIFQGILNDVILNNDNEHIRIMNFLLYFYYILKDKNEDNIISIYSEIFNAYYEEIEDKQNLINLFLNNKYLPKEKDLGLMLMKEKTNSFLQQLGLNILLFKGYFEEIFDLLIKDYGINKAILFLKKYQNYITEAKIYNILKNFFNKNEYDQYSRYIFRLLLKTDVNEEEEEEENPYLQTVL